MTEAINDLEKRAHQGDSEAQVALARHYEGESKTALARGWFARAAKLGNVAALRCLAINLLTEAPTVEIDGVNMIRAAADKGDAEAAYVCGMLAAQDSALEGRWRVAQECVVHAADRGWDLARAQLNLLGSAFDSSDVGAFTAPLPSREIFASPRISVIENCASPEICDWLIERARPSVRRSMVYDRLTGGGSVNEVRTNSSVAFSVVRSDLIMMLLRARIAATVVLPLESLEPTSILHYAPGERFEPHFDFFDSASVGYVRELATRGQRVGTFLLYLNDDYEGGETDFPNLDWRYKGRTGDALLFWNVTESGEPDRQTRHAGLPTHSGEKWLLSQWLRQR